ncbi:MAG: hypothetical protein IPO05_13560 [Flavobacteriales bacterium]|nr:hypothetical protein [Flavobacteriales bacterium]
MKKILIIALSLFDQLAIGQADHSAILRTDPFMSGGYFIVDDEQRQALRATRISVDVFINEQQQRRPVCRAIEPDHFHTGHLVVRQGGPRSHTPTS